MTEGPITIEGIIPPLVTPLLDHEQLDVEALRRLVDFVIAEGVHGVFVMGTSGEAMSVTEPVWRSVIARAVEFVAGRVPLFCGVIDTCTSRVVEKVRVAEELGAEVVVATPPFYVQPVSQDEVVRHFESICRSTSLKVAVYNIPATTHVNILPETIVRIAGLDNVVLCKDSSANWEQFQRCLFLLENAPLRLFNGAEELCAASLIFGAAGCVPGLANFFPRLFVELFEAARGGRIRRSYELQKRIWQIRQVLSVGRSWMSVMKYLAGRMGFGGDRAAMPAEPLSPRQKQDIDRILEQAGVHSRGAETLPGQPDLVLESGDHE
jgi:4-hydroxy-tetrahydrodipicolinate synthase